MLDQQLGLAGKGKLIRHLRACCPHAVIVCLALDAQESSEGVSLAAGASASMPKGSLTVRLLRQLRALVGPTTDRDRHHAYEPAASR